MFKAIGRFLRKVFRNLKKAAKVVMGIPENSKSFQVREYRDENGNLVQERIEVDPLEDAATDWVALKFVSIVVVAAGVFFLAWPVAPAASPVLAALGGALVDSATSMWKGREWDPMTSQV